MCLYMYRCTHMNVCVCLQSCLKYIGLGMALRSAGGQRALNVSDQLRLGL